MRSSFFCPAVGEDLSFFLLREAAVDARSSGRDGFAMAWRAATSAAISSRPIPPSREIVPVKYASTTGLGTVFSGHEKLTHFGQKKVLSVITKATLKIKELADRAATDAQLGRVQAEDQAAEEAAEARWVFREEAES